jgi:hypothetical protein
MFSTNIYRRNLFDLDESERNCGIRMRMLGSARYMKVRASAGSECEDLQDPKEGVRSAFFYPNEGVRICGIWQRMHL